MHAFHYYRDRQILSLMASDNSSVGIMFHIQKNVKYAKLFPKNSILQIY